MIKIKQTINLLIITYVLSLLFFYAVAVVFINRFSFENFLSKLFVLIYILIIIRVFFWLQKFWDKYYKEGDFNWMIFGSLLWFVVIVSGIFGSDVYKSEKNYIGLSSRVNNKKEYFMNYETGDRGERYDYEDSYYLEPTIKNYVVNKYDDEYETNKNILKKTNIYVGEEKYKYWQAALLDGYKSKNNSYFFVNAFYYILELTDKTIPTLIIVLLINFIIQIISRFKYHLLSPFISNQIVEDN